MALLTTIALIATVVSAGVSAYSSIQQGKAASRMASYNALIAKRNADLALKRQELQQIQIRIEEKRHREKSKRTIATQRTLFGKAGVVSETGTPLLVMADTAAEAELDAISIRLAGSAEEARIVAEGAGFEQQSQLAKMRGSAAKTVGRIGAGSALLSGITQFQQLKAS
jgi:hypothetical protein